MQKIKIKILIQLYLKNIYYLKVKKFKKRKKYKKINNIHNNKN